MLTSRTKGSEYHHGNLRAAAIASGLRLVEAKGIQSLSLRKIADSLHVSSPSLYRHFDGLDGLQAAISQSVRQQMAQKMLDQKSSVGTSGSVPLAVAEFGAIGSAYIGFARENPRLFEAAFTYCPVLPSAPDNPSAMTVLIDAIENLRDKGLIVSEKAELANTIAWSAVHGFATLITQRAVIEDAHFSQEEAVLGSVFDSIIVKADC